MPDDLADLPQPEYEGPVAVDALETDGDNPNEMTDEQFGLLCDRMRQNGWLGGPVVTNTDGLIADGEHRWRAAQDIGLSEVPVRQYDIDDAERRLWRQELNKIHGEHDTKRDALEYDYLLDAGKADEVHDLTDAAGEDLDELLAEIKMDTAMPPAYEYDPEHNVYFEDCVEGMRERLDDDSVDCVITDPPYGIEYEQRRAGDTQNEYKPTVQSDGLDEATELWRKFLSEVARVLKPDGHAYIFGPPLERDIFLPLVKENLDFKNPLVWVKSNHTLTAFHRNYAFKYEDVYFAVSDGERARDLSEFSPNVLEHAKPDTSDYDHPTEKPVGLIADLLTNSTQPRDRILDPFMGSGTTAVAAVQNDREYVGFELDEDNYRDVIERRIGEAKRQVNATVND